MKMKYFYTGLIFLSAIMLGSCDENEMPKYPEENDELVETTENTEINVGTDLLEVIKGESKTHEITEGAGEYKVTVIDRNIAEASVEDKTITINGLQKGVTEVIVSDKDGNRQLFKVNVYLSDNIVTNKDEVNVYLPFGQPTNSSFFIIAGNDGYELTCSDESGEVITAEFDKKDPNKILISAKKEGEAEVTITDERGLVKTVKINAIYLDSAFSPEMLEEIKKDETVRYYYHDNNHMDLYHQNFRVYLKGNNSYKFNSSSKCNNKKKYGMGYKSNGFSTAKYAISVCFDNLIDYEIGEKSDGMLVVTENSKWITNMNGVSCSFEIIKHENGKVWATYYAEESSTKKHYGYMVFEE